MLIHGNGLTQGQYSDFVRRMQRENPEKPIICNEDSPCFTRLDAAAALGTSWGYYNNYTKQIPPCDWGITVGEDTFYARRMMRLLSIPMAPLQQEDQYILQGLAPEDAFGSGYHCLRLACEYPENVRCVHFYEGDQLLDISWDEPYFCRTETTWLGGIVSPVDQPYRAVIELNDGTILTREARFH